MSNDNELKDLMAAIAQLARLNRPTLKDAINAMKAVIGEYEPPVTQEDVDRWRAEFEAVAGPLGYDLSRPHGGYFSKETYRASRLHEDAQMLWEKREQGGLEKSYRALGDLYKELGVGNQAQALAKIDRLLRRHVLGRFAVGQKVKKVTGDYKIKGVVRSVFTKQDGGVRLVVEHTAEGGGSFLHIYGEANLEADDGI